MYLLGLSLLLLALKVFAIGPVAAWSWLWIVLPFGLTAAWWAWADWSGYTHRKAAQRQSARAQERIARNKTRLRTGEPRKPR